MHRLREYLAHTYRRILDVLGEMPGIVDKFDLSVNKLPDFTTICMPKQGLEMWIWRVLLWLSVQLRDPASIQTIDAPVFDRVAAKRHNANLSFRSVKTTVLVDRKTSLIYIYIA